MNTLKDIVHYVLAKADWMKTLVGMAVILIYFMIVRSLINQELPNNNREPLIHVLGSFDGVFSMLVGYYFGSSKGSQEKQEIIKNMEKPKP